LGNRWNPTVEKRGWKKWEGGEGTKETSKIVRNICGFKTREPEGRRFKKKTRERFNERVRGGVGERGGKTTK